MGKLEEAQNPHLTFDEQASDVGTPTTGLWRAFFKADGMYVIDDAGIVTGPFGGGSGSGALSEIDEVSLASDAASISFSSIPATYKDLLIVGELRSDRAASHIDNLHMQVGNGSVDTGSNYRYITSGITQAGTAYANEGAAVTAIDCGAVNAGSASAGRRGPVEVTVLRYVDTSQVRHVRSSCSVLSDVSNMRTTWGDGAWDNTAAAIDIVTFTPDIGSNFVAGSYLTLYGRGTA